MWQRIVWPICCVSFVFATFSEGQAQAPAETRRISHDNSQTIETGSTDVLTAAQWQRVDDSVDRALEWLAGQQQRDGSFPTLPQGQPGVTSLCVMAFMAHGHLPGEGPFGVHLTKSIQYIHRCQHSSGLLAVIAPRGTTISRSVNFKVGSTAAYNHAISALLLAEAFAVGGSRKADEARLTIEKAIEATLEMQNWEKSAADAGGWRYLDRHDDFDSDLSLTGWQLMFLRSAKNAGFDVSQEPIDDAVSYVQRCFHQRAGSFNYAAIKANKCTRAMAGAGVLALAHAGKHDLPEARAAGRWILEHHFHHYNDIDAASTGDGRHDRYHYGLFNCCQAMYQLGGDYWSSYFPPAVGVLLDSQRPDGSWPAEDYSRDRPYGNAYTTSLVVLALGAPNQLLPVFQR